MSLDRSRKLLAEGYDRVAVKSVALAHTVWKTDLTVSCDRRLTLAEETVLGLINTGVLDPTEITRLMGVDAGVIVPRTIVELLTKGLLRHIDGLAITPLGQQALTEERVKVERTYDDMWIRHDPYSNTFVWSFKDEVLSLKEARSRGLHALPNPLELRPLDVEIRHGEVQELLDRFGLPIDEGKGKLPQRDIIRLTARSAFPAWRPAELEVWFQPEREEWAWRLMYQGGEVEEISDSLRKMQADGVEILPLEREPRPVEVSRAGHRVHTVAEEVVQSPRSRVLQGAEHREALQDAIKDARKELIIVSPWLRTDAVDNELLGWLQNALQRNRGLRVIVGYGIERDQGQQDRKARNQRAALRRLNSLGNRNRGRLRTVEIGNTHEKIVICDGRYAIVTSFNFLSYNPRPGRGIRREMGVVIEDREQVQALRQQLARDLRL